MQVVILAGGRGERLQPLTARLPKPLIPFFDQPLLGYQLDHLAAQGIDEAFITAGHLGDAITRFAAQSRTGIRLHVVQEDSARGTAGAVADLAPVLRSPFLVVSGDAVLDLDLQCLLDVHHDVEALATICTAPVAERLRFGYAEVREAVVTRFAEKPSLDELTPGMAVNTGCYLLEAETLRYCGSNCAPDFARDVFPAILGAGHRIGAAPALRFWRDIGTPTAYRDAQLEAVVGHWPWKSPPSARPTYVGCNAEIIGPVHLGPGVLIGAYARIVGPAYLGARSTVGPHAVVTRSVLLAGAEVGAGTCLSESVVDESVHVPTGLALGAALVAGALAHPGATLPPLLVALGA